MAAARTRAIFGSTSAMNDWPPNPGKTVMQSTRSTWSRKGSSASKGVSGLAASPTRSPRSRIWAMRTAVSPTSTCTVQPLAPASRNGSRYRAGSVIIRWVSKKRSLWFRSDATTGGPMVRFGTKWPSITSTWSQSVPGVTRATASARLPKSAERIEGATRRSGGWEAEATIGSEPTGGSRACDPGHRGRSGGRTGGPWSAHAGRSSRVVPSSAPPVSAARTGHPRTKRSPGPRFGHRRLAHRRQMGEHGLWVNRRETSGEHLEDLGRPTT